MGKLFVGLILSIVSQVSLDVQKFTGEVQVCSTVKARTLKIDIVFNKSEYELKRTYVDSQSKNNESKSFRGNYTVQGDTIMLDLKLKYNKENLMLLTKQNSLIIFNNSDLNFYKGLKIEEIKKLYKV